MPNVHEIIIESGNPSNGDLIIKGGDDIIVDVEDTVSWSISDGSNVTLFKIKKKEGYKRIFTQWDPIEYGRSLKRKVKSNAGGKVYKYSIHWKEDNGPNKIYDPKITVNPTGFNFLKLLVGFILSLILAFLSFKFLNKKRNRK